MAFTDQIQQVAAAPIAATVGNTSVLGGAASAIYAWLGGPNAIGWAGFVVGIGGLALSFWHKRAIQRLEREKFEWQKSQDQAARNTS